MKNTLLLLFVTSMIYCQEKEVSSNNPVNWERRIVKTPLGDSLEAGGTYLSVYSQIYSMTELRTHDLTVTVSIRNTDRADSIYITKAEYFDSKGESIRVYFDQPIYLSPMETVDIVIAGVDRQGGTGANFVFDWKIQPGTQEPLFEAIMISTLGQQGLSFSTQGKRIY
ncbi:MAG: DUF3124 domain-containing protein [Bacteroidota bacterium]